jgi:hypothetical protein
LSYSQKTDGFDFDGGIISSSLDDLISFYGGFKYNYWFCPYVGFAVGVMVSHSKIDMIFPSPQDRSVSYDIEDDNIINLTGITEVKFSSPVYKGFGISSDFNFLFEPVPFNTVSIDKNIFDAK